MNRRGLLIAFTVLAVVGLLAAWWVHTFERVEEDVPVPLHGEARYNPLYGLKKALQAHGVEVDSRANLNLRAMELGEEDTLILAADVRTLSAAQAEELLDWVDDGGHLVFSLPQGSEGRGGDLIESLKLSVTTHRTCVDWPAEGKPAEGSPVEGGSVEGSPVDGKTDNAEHCFGYAFKLAAGARKQFSLLLGDKDKGQYYLGRRAHGEGDWTAAGNLEFLYTEELKRPGYAQFAWQVLAPVIRSGKVHLVYAADVPPLHVLLVRYGWPALLPALLALLAWLWARSQRFGPLLPVAAANRRALREHIQAAGEFTFRRRRAATLYAAVRRAFDERLRRDAPAIAALDGEALVEALAKHSGQTQAVLRHALIPFNLAEPEQFFVAIKTLTELRARS